MQLTRNFADEEFKCPCCGEFADSLPFRAFLAKLQDARSTASVPFVITSGYRCPKYNAAIGGKADSSHLEGIAADIRTQTPLERFAIVDGLIKAGFGHLGIGKDFIHVDALSSIPGRLEAANHIGEAKAFSIPCSSHQKSIYLIEQNQD